MRKFLVMAAALTATSGAASAQNYVNGYVRQDGTYVQPHYRSSPDTNRFNNYSAQGNVNPYTGQRGSIDPYRPQPVQPGFGGTHLGSGNQRRW